MLGCSMLQIYRGRWAIGTRLCISVACARQYSTLDGRHLANPAFGSKSESTIAETKAQLNSVCRQCLDSNRISNTNLDTQKRAVLLFERLVASDSVDVDLVCKMMQLFTTLRKWDQVLYYFSQIGVTGLTADAKIYHSLIAAYEQQALSDQDIVLASFDRLPELANDPIQPIVDQMLLENIEINPSACKSIIVYYLNSGVPAKALLYLARLKAMEPCLKSVIAHDPKTLHLFKLTGNLLDPEVVLEVLNSFIKWYYHVQNPHLANYYFQLMINLQLNPTAQSFLGPFEYYGKQEDKTALFMWLKQVRTFDILKPNVLLTIIIAFVRANSTSSEIDCIATLIDSKSSDDYLLCRVALMHAYMLAGDTPSALAMFKLVKQAWKGLDDRETLNLPYMCSYPINLALHMYLQISIDYIHKHGRSSREVCDDVLSTFNELAEDEVNIDRLGIFKLRLVCTISNRLPDFVTLLLKLISQRKNNTPLNQLVPNQPLIYQLIRRPFDRLQIFEEAMRSGRQHEHPVGPTVHYNLRAVFVLLANPLYNNDLKRLYNALMDYYQREIPHDRALNAELRRIRLEKPSYGLKGNIPFEYRDSPVDK